MQLAQAEGLKVARQQLGRCNAAASSVAAKVLYFNFFPSVFAF